MKKFLFLAAMLAICATAIVVFAPGNVNAVGTPTENYTIPNLPTNDPSHDEIKPLVSFTFAGPTSQAVSSPPSIISSFTGSSIQNTYTIVGDGKWYLDVDINAPGWLYIYEYYPPEKNEVAGRWLAYKWQLKQGGIWKLGPFSAGDKEPEGQHVYRMWFYGEGQWASTDSDALKKSLIYWTYFKSYPELKVLDFNTSSASIQQGEIVTISWNVQNARDIIISKIGPVTGPSGTQSVVLDKTTDFTLIATGLDGSKVQSGPLTVSITALIPAGELPVTPPSSPQTPTEVSFIDWIVSPIPLISILSVLVIIGLGFLLLRVYKRRWAPSPATIPLLDKAKPEVVKQEARAEDKLSEAVPAEVIRAKLALPGGLEILLAGNSRIVGRIDLARALEMDELCRISHNHFEVTYKEGQYFIEDTADKTSTYLNGFDIKGKGKFALKDGDTINLEGVAELKYSGSD